MTMVEDKEYFAKRAAEEAERALEAGSENAAEAHRRLQRVYTERASVGDRPHSEPEIIG